MREDDFKQIRYGLEQIGQGLAIAGLAIGAGLLVHGCYAALPKANAALPPPADGPVAVVPIEDDQNARSMNFASITPSTNFEAADLMGPAPDPRVERHGEILRAWAAFRILEPQECCEQIGYWYGIRLVAEFMRKESR